MLQRKKLKQNNTKKYTMPKNMIYDDVSEKAGAPKKMKTNEDGGSVTAQDSSAAGKQIESNQAKEGGARKGAAKGMDHKKGGGARYMDHKKGGAKYTEGPADFPKTGTQEHMASVKHSKSGEHLGAKRMGYNQSFGAARVSGYSKGAAKVADIMTFGASKYMRGAADAGHGGVAGHDHPSMTTKTRTTSGGGSSSSKSSTSSTGGTSNYDAVVKSEGTRIVDPSKITPEMTAAANKKRADAKKLDASMNSSSTSSNPGSSTTSSETITSPKSMSEVTISGQIANENRNQTNAYNREMTNIQAATDSTSTANNFLNKLPAYKQNTPNSLVKAQLRGSDAATRTRIESNNFSPSEAVSIRNAGRKKAKDAYKASQN